MVNAATRINQITPDDLLQSAHRIAATLKERTAQIDSERSIAPETIEAIKDAGLFRLLQPKRWGGFETTPQAFIDVENIFAEQCLSTAWVFGVLSVQSFMLSLFNERAQEDVWGSDETALASSSFQPIGKAERVEGGFKLSGQWPYSSGSQYAQWAVVGALVPPLNAGEPPEMRLFLVPRIDYEIVDTWNTFGLRGTGSNDIRIEHAIVPEYRTLKPEQGFVPGSKLSVHNAALYRMPWLYVFTCSVASLGIGGARGALREFLDITRARLATPSGKARVDTSALQIAARAKGEIEEIDQTFRRNVARLMECAASGEAMTLAEALQHRVHLTSIIRRCAGLVDNLLPHLGARSVFLDSAFTRFWLDLNAARVHPGNDPATTSGDLGKLLIES
ncbi:MAG: acyl-CoA dehydrogenase type 2 [Verrucomicrobiaceae bacterium]|nr:acyl-CoA dehydrogenase type 2 [Verrucomicrobiaceae bacterium]